MLRTLKSIRFVGLIVFFIITGPGKEVLSQEKGLVLEYDFSEGAGDILKDKSGNENDGIISGAKWIKEDKGYSLYFDGVDDYVEVKHSPSLEIGDEFTVEVLVKPGENPKKKGFGTYRVIIGKNGDFWNAQSSFALYINEGGRIFTGYIRYGPKKSEEENEVYTVSGQTMKPNPWPKVVLVKTKDSLKLYADSSTPSASKDTPEKMIFSTQPLRIGGIPGRFFEGYIKEIKIFNYRKFFSF